MANCREKLEFWIPTTGIFLHGLSYALVAYYITVSSRWFTSICTQSLWKFIAAAGSCLHWSSLWIHPLYLLQENGNAKPLQTWYHDSLSTLLLWHGMLLAIYGLHLFRCVTSRTCTISHACRNILPIVKNSFEEANICSRPKSHAKDLESRQL